MKKIVSAVRHLFAVQYRLSILYSGETEPRHIYGANGRLLRRMAYRSAKYQYWTLYKTGPFGLEEREVDFSEQFNR